MYTLIFIMLNNYIFIKTNNFSYNTLDTNTKCVIIHHDYLNRLVTTYKTNINFIDDIHLIKKTILFYKMLFTSSALHKSIYTNVITNKNVYDNNMFFFKNKNKFNKLFYKNYVNFKKNNTKKKFFLKNWKLLKQLVNINLTRYQIIKIKKMFIVKSFLYKHIRLKNSNPKNKKNTTKNSIVQYTTKTKTRTKISKNNEIYMNILYNLSFLKGLAFLVRMKVIKINFFTKIIKIETQKYTKIHKNKLVYTNKNTNLLLNNNQKQPNLTLKKIYFWSKSILISRINHDYTINNKIKTQKNNLKYFFFKSIFLKNLFKNNPVQQNNIIYFLPFTFLSLPIYKEIIKCRDNSNNLIKTNLNYKYNSSQSQYRLNNYMPLTLANQINKLDKNIKKKLNFESVTYKLFFNFYLIYIIEQITLKKVLIKVNTKKLFNVFWKKYINNFLKKYTTFNKKANNFININTLIEIIVLTFLIQDLNIFLKYIKYIIERVHFKKHKKILSILFDIFKKNKTLISLTQIKGFSFDIRGKVGVSGNAKKRHLFFSIGTTTTTSLKIKSSLDQISVWTPTGQMGITCLIQY